MVPSWIPLRLNAGGLSQDQCKISLQKITYLINQGDSKRRTKFSLQFKDSPRSTDKQVAHLSEPRCDAIRNT